MKFKAKSLLACAVLLSVMSVGTLAEAEWRYKVDDGTELTWNGTSDLIGTGNKLEVWSSDGSDSSSYYIYGGYDGTYPIGLTIEDRTVIFNSGTASYIYGGYVQNGNVRNNIVNITGGTVSARVYGGNGYGDATDNVVNISGGNVENVCGGNGNGDAKYNTVNISGGNVVTVYGGNGNGDIIGNTVKITGGTVTGAITGGSGGYSSGNKVIVSGGDLSIATVYGYGGSSSSHSDNTLQIENSVTIKGIYNFDKLSFVLPDITGNKTMLSLTNAFYLGSVAVSAYLGNNTNNTLNNNYITLADNVRGDFNVTYYDEDGNPTGYVENFSFGSSIGAMIIGEGTKMHLTKNLTTAPNELLGNQNTIYVDDGVTLTFSGIGELEKKVQGACNIIIDGDVRSSYDYLEDIRSLTVNAGKTLTLQGDGTLARNIAGAGTVRFDDTVNVLGNRSIEGTLVCNWNILNMTNNAAGSPINYLMVGTLKGNSDLQLDVDLSRLTSDMIIANAVDSGANINVMSINITADNPAGMPTPSNIVFLIENGGTPTHGNYTVNHAAGSITLTNTHTYKFELGGNGILKCSEIGGSTATFRSFIEGTGTGADTLSLTEDFNYTDTGTANMGATTQTHDTLNINLNGHNLNKISTVMTVATGAKTLNLNGGSTEGSTDLNFDVATGGTLNISGKTDVKGNITNAGTTTFAGETKAEGTLSGAGSYTNSGTMTVENTGKLQMTSSLENTGTLNLGNSSNSVLGANITGTGTTVIAGNVTNNDKTITQNILNITGTFTTDASNLVIAEVINNSGNVTFNAGTLGQKVQGIGNITIDGDVTTNANYIATTGINKVESGKKLTFNAGTLTQKIEGAGDLSFEGNVTANADNIATTGTNEVTTGATLNFAGGTLRKNITGGGTTEFNSTTGVADGVNLGTTTNNVNGTMDVPGHITASNINFKNGSTLKVDGNQIIGTAAINVSTSATVENGSKLYVTNAIKDTAYKILAGTGISVNSWQTDEAMGEGFKAAYGLKVDTSSIINNTTEFTIKFVKDAAAIDNIDIGDLLDNASPSSALYKYVDTLSQAQPDRATQATVINTMANMNSLANVQQGTQTVMAMATDALQTNIGTGARPMFGRNSGNRGQVSGMLVQMTKTGLL